MFAFLRGTIARKRAGIVELDVHGAGYEVCVPDTVHRKLVVNQDATLLTYCHIREDAFQIFGFLKEEQKNLFRLLLDVSGVGPKVALAILSGMGVGEIGRAILDSDVTAFTKISGVGKKTAQRLVLEMKAKLGQETELKAILGETGEESSPETDDVIAALCALGCSLNEARKAAGDARRKMPDDAAVEDLIKAALQSVARV